MKLAFLVGAGASIPAGLPSTETLSQLVTSGDGFARHTDNNYYSMPPLYGQTSDPHVSRIVPYLAALKAEAVRYYATRHPRKKISYEDLYYLAVQVRDAVTEAENPAIQPFVERLWQSVSKHAIVDSGDLKMESKIDGLFHEAEKYIVCRVWHALSQRPSRLDHLDCLFGAVRDLSVRRLDVFTLNHDTLLEQGFASRGVSYADGFGAAVNSVRYWEPGQFSRLERVNIFKLHGSVNWFRFPPNARVVRNPYGISLRGDPRHTKNPDGHSQWPDRSQPEILIGTFNKLLSYSSGIYAELYHAFYTRLEEADRLVCAGYSFGDRGINSRLIDWLLTSKDHRLVVIEPSPDLLRQSAQFSIGNVWRTWETRGQLQVIPKCIEETVWEEAKARLMSDTSIPAS